ncbi:phosphate ABC transporter substrate-binding protein PstS [Aeropyrum camini]|uniref:phosphate ABC transporter substrate-binding protein PstS n=1 Tax=Aeropyrum camini TaxID=229980 RepID=UPI0034E1EB81
MGFAGGQRYTNASYNRNASYSLQYTRLEDLKLNAEVIALIYKGEIEFWDDPRIASLNPGASLPHEKIVAVHRSDSSGTTHVFTIFLHKAAPNVWTADLVGKAINWPVDGTGRGVGGKGNQGVMEVVKNTPYSIGYVEYAYVAKAGGGVQVAMIENREGVFLKPTPEGAQAAASGAASTLPGSPDADWSEGFDSIIYAPGENSYPITSWSFLLFYKQYDDKEKAEAIKKLIEWINTEGQEKVVEGYIPIPNEIRQINMKAVDMIYYRG